MKPTLILLAPESIPESWRGDEPRPEDFALPLRGMLYDLERSTDVLREHFNEQVLCLVAALLRRASNAERRLVRTYCGYCGESFHRDFAGWLEADGPPDAGAVQDTLDELKGQVEAHILACPRHPLSMANARIKELEGQLEKLRRPEVSTFAREMGGRTC